MRPDSKYKKLKKILFSVPTIIIMAVIVSMVGVAAFNMYQTYRDTHETVERLQAERTELVNRKKAAKTAAASIATKRGLREEIREKFSVAKPGERVVVLTDARQRKIATSTKRNSTSWWQNIIAEVWPF